MGEADMTTLRRQSSAQTDVMLSGKGTSVSTVRTSPALNVAASRGDRWRRVTWSPNTTPRRYTTFLVASILAAFLMSLIVFATYSNINDTVTLAGQDSVPSIVAADHIQALVASADANALNAVVTKS